MRLRTIICVCVVGVVATLSYTGIAWGGTVDVIYQSHRGGIFKAWYDFNGDGDYGDANEYLGRGGAGAFLWKLASPIDSFEPASKSLYESGGDYFFRTFCIEYLEDVRTGVRSYNLVEAALAPEANGPLPPMGQEKAQLLGQWFGAYYQDLVNSNWAANLTSYFQMGIWEIVYEDLPEIGNVADGKFIVKSTSFADAQSVVNDWFSADWQNQGSHELIALSASTGAGLEPLQDQITVISMPVPSAVWAAGAMMLLLGIARRSSNRRLPPLAVQTAAHGRLSRRSAD